MKKKEIKTIVKINAPLAQANEWTRKAKQLNKSRSEYLLDIINQNQNNKPSLLKLIVNKIKGN
jgi:hypothetical protein